jgi:hypothetical protein
MVASRQQSVPRCALPGQSKRSPKCKKRNKRILHLELLEARLLLAADADPFRSLLSHGGICHCLACAGLAHGDAPPETEQTADYSSGPAAAGLVVPELSSRPGAAATLYLDFDGHFQAEWGAWTNIVSPAFDRDGDPTTFSESEISTITNIWSRVAEDFAPFNVNVTTVEPPSFGNGEAVRIVISGGWADWYGTQTGGVAFIGSFTNDAPNVAYVFENDLGNGFPRWVAEAVSHEAGHTFGLLHQSTWWGNTLQSEYNTGENDWAPIMGNGNFAQRTTWHNGTTNESPTSFQDDLAILAGVLGYVGDDYGDTMSDAAVLPIDGTNVNVAGLIGHNGDVDVFRFATAGGDLSFSLAVASFGANLDSVLELWDANGQVLLVANDPWDYGTWFETTVEEGTYYVAVRSTGGYGNLGQYTLTGTLEPGVVAQPRIKVLIDGVEVPSGAKLDFGTTQVGKPVTRTVTITNTGEGDLHLDPLSLDGCPPGCTLVADLDRSLLAPGESASFTLQFDATIAGSFSGTLQILSNDSEQETFDLQLEGTVLAPPPPPPPVIKTIDNGAAGFKTTGKWQLLKNRGYEKDVHIASKIGKKDKHPATATYTFTGLQPGEYRVSITWTSSPSHASNSPFSVRDGGKLLKTVAVNQKKAPGGFQWNGAKWQNLGTFVIQGNRLVVQLTNRANAKVVADAVRIERLVSTSHAALPGSSGLIGTAADAAPLSAALWLTGESAAPTTPLVSAETTSGRLSDYWHALAGAAMAWSPAVPAEQLLRQHADLLPELTLLGQADGLLDELALHLATQHDGRADW